MKKKTSKLITTVKEMGMSMDKGLYLQICHS